MSDEAQRDIASALKLIALALDKVASPPITVPSVAAWHAYPLNPAWGPNPTVASLLDHMWNDNRLWVRFASDFGTVSVRIEPPNA
jgi:hypothetical protein